MDGFRDQDKGMSLQISAPPTTPSFWGGTQGLILIFAVLSPQDISRILEVQSHLLFFSPPTLSLRFPFFVLCRALNQHLLLSWRRGYVVPLHTDSYLTRAGEHSITQFSGEASGWGKLTKVHP